MDKEQDETITPSFQGIEFQIGSALIGKVGLCSAAYTSRPWESLFITKLIWSKIKKNLAVELFDSNRQRRIVSRLGTSLSQVLL